MYQDHSEEKKQNLSDISDLIESFIKTGMEMLISTMNSKEVLKSDLASILLFRQTLEAGDALAVLVRTGCINASKPLVRSLLECYFQLGCLYNGNEERKALQFLYHYEMRQREYYEKLVFPEKSGSFFEKLKKDKYLKGDDISTEQKRIYFDNIKKIDFVLNGDDNKEIAEEYLRIENKKKSIKTGKKGKISSWYELFDGPSSVEEISIVLDEAGLYQLIYRNCSSYSHGEDIVHANLEPNNDNTFKIAALRDLRQMTIVSNNALLLIERSCLLFLKEKVGDKEEFAIKFAPSIHKKKEYTTKI